MAIIGINSSEGLGAISSTATESQIMLRNATYSYVAQSNEEVFRLGAEIGNSIGDGLGIGLALYDISAGVSGASLIASGTIATLVTGSNSVSITPVGLTAGNTYAVAVRVISTTNVSLFRNYLTNGCNFAATAVGSSAFTSTWAEGSTLNQQYGIWAETQTASASDTTPDQFTFTDVTGQALSTAIESNVVTITGIDASTAISVDAGEYRINGGTYVTAAGTLVVNDTVQLRHTSSASNSTLTSQVLTIGGVTDQFDVTTLASVPTPVIPVVSNANSINLGSVATGSLSIDLSAQGNNRALIIIYNPKLTTTAATSLTSLTLDSVGVNRGIGTGLTRIGVEQIATEGDYASMLDAYVCFEADLPSAAGTYSIDSVLDSVPSVHMLMAFEVIGVATQAIDSLIEGQSLVNIDTPNPDTLDIVSSTVDSLVISMYSTSTFNTPVFTIAQTVVTNISGVQGGGFVSSIDAAVAGTNSFSYTIDQTSQRRVWKGIVFNGVVVDTTPNAFSFTDQVNTALNTTVLSNIVTITGIDSASAISITTNGTQFSINGGAFTSVASTVSLNDTVQLRLTSSATNSTTISDTLDIGGVSDTWSVTTLAAAAPSITDVNLGVITDGEVGITFSTANFAGEITSALVINGGTTTALNIASVGGSGTFDIPSSSTGGAALTTASNSAIVRLGDGTDTADIAITYSPSLGSAVQEVSSAIKTVGSVFENFVGIIPDGSQVYYSTSSNTAVSSTGLLTTDSAIDIDMLYWDSTLLAWNQFTVIISVLDTTIPIISLLGSTPISVEVNATYNDAGATALDNIDGDISGAISTVNPVNTAILGQYAVTYNVSDTAGNNAVQVSRTVNVVDTVIPVILLVGSSSINLSLGDSYTDAGATASDNFDGDLTGSIVTANPVNTSISASYTVTYDVTDSEGNVAVQVTRTVIVSAVPDTTIPIISLLGTTPTSVEVNTTYNDAGATALDNIDGDISGSISTVNPVNISLVGTYTVTYNVADSAGNNAVQVIRTVNVVDSVPQPFNFADQTDISVSSLILSNTISIVGLSIPSVISISGNGGEFSIDGGAFTSTSSTITNGQSVQLRQTSSAVNSTLTSTTLNIGGETNQWDVTTLATVISAPVITMVGAPFVVLAIGDAYTDAGATAYDVIDGDLTDSIVETNQVNVNVAGIYQVRYDVDNSQFVSAVQVVRYVTVQTAGGGGDPLTINGKPISGGIISAIQIKANSI